MPKSLENFQENQNNLEQEPEYDAILVLGAVMEWNDKSSSWDFPTIIDRYPGKLVMGKARAIATSYIHEKTPIVLVTGGSDKNPVTGQLESRSVQLSNLITDRYGVPKEKVISIGTLGASHTLGNVENLVQYLNDNPEILKSKKVGILLPRFQKERTELMFEQNQYFKENKIQLDWLIVEDILEHRDDRYKKWVDAVYATPEAEINRIMEKKGITDLQMGKYKSETPNDRK